MNAFRSGFGFGYQHSFSRAQIFSQNIHNSQKFATATRLAAVFIAAFITGFSVSRIFTPVKDTVAESPINITTLESKSKIASVNPIEPAELASLITPDSAKIVIKTTKTEESTASANEPTDAPDPTETKTKKTKKAKITKKAAKKSKKATQNDIFFTGTKNITVRPVEDTSKEASIFFNILPYPDYKFAYIHNYILGTLGDTFSITKNGKTTTYKVVKKVTYTCSKNGKTGCHGHNYLFKGSKTISMGAIANSDYDLAIMTCAGKSLGNGDATKRLVFYAQKL